MEAEIVRVSKEHPTLGYKKVAALLRELGYAINKKWVQRVRREEFLRVPPPRKRLRRQGLSTGLPQRAVHRNHVWGWDFVSDYTQRGGSLRLLNIVDEYTRECHCIHADRTLKATDVLDCLADAIDRQGAPQYIRSDNGPEFIAKAIQRWLAAHEIKTIYIDPGCPWQNGFAEGFNSRLRVECLDREVLHTLSEARVVTSDWMDYYNHIRPHRSLGLKTPADFATINRLPGPGSGRPTASLHRSLEPNPQHQHTRKSLH